MVEQQQPPQQQQHEALRIVSSDMRQEVKTIAISPNKDAIIFGGANALKMMKIEEDYTIKNVMKNFASKNAGTKGASEIKWNQRQHSHVLTSKVQTINFIDLNSKNMIYKKIDEEQKVNSLSWNPFNPSQFISASGPSIKLRDLSLDHVVLNLQRNLNQDKIHFVQFNPNRETILASGNSKGRLEIWDLRQAHMPLHSFQAHLSDSHINYIDWHPSEENVLISGSNERYIKVWNLRESGGEQYGQINKQPVIQIYSPSSVKKCQWIVGDNQQQQINNLIISSSNTSSSVNVWHLKKPYLQQYIYKHQKEVIQDFEWLIPNEVLVTAYQTNISFQHISTTIRPYQQICTTALSFNLQNELAVVNEQFINRNTEDFISSLNQGLNPEDLFKQSSQLNKGQKTTTGGGKSAGGALSSPKDKHSEIEQVVANKVEDGIMKVFSMEQLDSSLGEDLQAKYSEIAQMYKFKHLTSHLGQTLAAPPQPPGPMIMGGGAPQQASQPKNLKSQAEMKLIFEQLDELCLHNAEVAQQLGQYDVALSWQQLRDVAQEMSCLNKQQGNKDDHWKEKGSGGSARHLQQSSQCNQSKSQEKAQGSFKDKKQTSSLTRTRKHTHEITKQQTESKILSSVRKEEGYKIFENDYLEVQVFKDIEPVEEEAQLGIQKYERRSFPFPELVKQSSRCRHHSQNHQEAENTFQVVFGLSNSKVQNISNIQQANIKQKKKVVRLDHPTNQQKNGSGKQKLWIKEVMIKTVVETISFYSDNGDVQTAAFMTLVFHELLEQYGDYQGFICRIIISYLELLYTLQLNSHATEVIKYGPQIKVIQDMATKDKSYTLSLLCQFCRSKDEVSIDHICNDSKCGKINARCSICQLPVKNLYIWCQGCSHGGHYDHILKWFKSNSQCPAGCGHECREQQVIQSE